VTAVFILPWARNIRLFCNLVRSSAKYLFLILLQLSNPGCESNPLGGNEISGGKARIGGLVRLGNNPSAEGVFVWLDGFDISTRTDNAGRFEIILPPPAVQSVNGGLTGAFDLFFYMANFRLDSAAVLVTNGEFVYSLGDINNDGELLIPMNLEQLVSIRSVVLPDTVVRGDSGLISTRIFLETMQTTDTVRVVYPRNVNGLFNPIIFKKVDAEETLIFGATNVGILEGDTLKITNSSPVEIILIVGASSGDFTTGLYHAIPYLFVLQGTVPTGLISNIGSGVQELGPNYLKMPFLRDLRPLTVVESATEE